MKFLPLTALMSLCLLTDLIYRPLWDQRLATPDVPILFILWLASIDRRQRVYSVVIVLGALRSFCSVDTLPMPWLPLIVMVEAQFIFRGWVHLRTPFRRLPVVASTIAIGTALNGYLLTNHYGADLWLTTATAALYSTLAAAIIFPILDFFAPLLRSHRYPM
ncbi:MAG: hypothetical protein AAF581_12210 [Planctomycetota bacterium]